MYVFTAVFALAVTAAMIFCVIYKSCMSMCEKRTFEDMAGNEIYEDKRKD